MLQLGLQPRRVQWLCAVLSAGMLLACGDDEAADAMASSSDDGGSSREDSGVRSSERAPRTADGSRAMGSGGEGSKDPKGASDAGAMEGASDEADPRDDAQRAPDAMTEAPATADPASDDDAGAGEPQSMKVAVRFEAKVGTEAFACGRKYASQGAAQTTVTPRDLRLFVHDVALIAADGAEVRVSLSVRAPWQAESLALLDFEDKTGRCADGTSDVNTVITGTVPAGSYRGIRFVMGVPEDLNHEDPLRASEPLQSAAALHWSALAGYRFATVEMIQAAASSETPGVGVFQLGSADCSGSPSEGTVSCGKPNRSVIELDGFDVSKNSVVIDVATFFSRVDLSQKQECHSTEPLCDSMFGVAGLDYATGLPRVGQTLFRVGE